MRFARPSGSQETVSTAVFLSSLFQVKSQDWFDAWVSKLRHHRLYRQNEIVRSPRDASFHIFPATSTAESSPAANVSVVDGKVWLCLRWKKSARKLLRKLTMHIALSPLKTPEREVCFCDLTPRKQMMLSRALNTDVRQICESPREFLYDKWTASFLCDFLGVLGGGRANICLISIWELLGSNKVTPNVLKKKLTLFWAIMYTWPRAIMYIYSRLASLWSECRSAGEGTVVSVVFQ